MASPHRAHQTAGSPALRGSVAAATEPSGAAGPPSTSSIACSWPRLRSKARGRDQVVAEGRERLGDARRVARLEVDVDRRREVVGRLDVPARRRDRGPDVDAAVDDGAHELGVDLRLGVAAHRAGDDPRPRLAVRNSIPGSSVWSVRLPGARTFGWSGSRLK